MSSTNISGSLSNLFMQSSMLSAKQKQSSFLSSAKTAFSPQASSLAAMNKALMGAFSGALASFQKSSMTMATANYSSMSKALLAQQLNFSAQITSSLKQSYQGSQMTSFMNLQINATASASPSAPSAAVTGWTQMTVNISMTVTTSASGPSTKTAAPAPVTTTTTPVPVTTTKTATASGSATKVTTAPAATTTTTVKPAATTTTKTATASGPGVKTTAPVTTTAPKTAAASGTGVKTTTAAPVTTTKTAIASGSATKVTTAPVATITTTVKPAVTTTTKTATASGTGVKTSAPVTTTAPKTTAASGTGVKTTTAAPVTTTKTATASGSATKATAASATIKTTTASGTGATTKTLAASGSGTAVTITKGSAVPLASGAGSRVVYAERPVQSFSSNAKTSNEKVATIEVTSASVQPQFMRINSANLATVETTSGNALVAAAPSAISAPGGNGQIKIINQTGNAIGIVNYTLTGKETNLEAMNKIAQAVNDNGVQVHATISGDGAGNVKLNLKGSTAENFSVSDISGNAAKVTLLSGSGGSSYMPVSSNGSSAMVFINQNEASPKGNFYSTATMVTNNDNVVEMNGYNINLHNNVAQQYDSRSPAVNVGDVKVRVGVANSETYKAVSSDSSSVTATGGEMGVKGIASSSVRVRVDQLAQTGQITGNALDANAKTSLKAGADVLWNHGDPTYFVLTGNETNLEALGKIATAINNTAGNQVTASVSTTSSGKASLVLEGKRADSALDMIDIRGNAASSLGLNNPSNITRNAQMAKVTIESNIGPNSSTAVNVVYNDIKTPNGATNNSTPKGSDLQIAVNKLTFQSNDIELQFNKVTNGKWINVYLK